MWALLKSREKKYAQLSCFGNYLLQAAIRESLNISPLEILSKIKYLRIEDNENIWKKI